MAFESSDSKESTVITPVSDLKIATPIRFVAGLGMLLETPGLNPKLKPERFEKLPVDLEKTQKLVDLLTHKESHHGFGLKGTRHQDALRVMERRRLDIP